MNKSNWKKTRWQSPWFVWNSLIGLLVHLLNWSPTLWQVYQHWPVTFLVLVPGQVTSGQVSGCPPCSGRGEVCNTVRESCECDTGYYITSSSPANDTSAVTGCEEGGWNISSLTRGLVTTLILLLQHHEFSSLSPPISPVPAPCLSSPVVFSLVGGSCHESLPLPSRYVWNCDQISRWKWQPYNFSHSIILCFVAYGSYCVTGDECISMNLHNSVCTQGMCQCRPGFFYPAGPMRTNCYEGSYIVAKCSGQ